MELNERKATWARAVRQDFPKEEMFSLLLKCQQDLDRSKGTRKKVKDPEGGRRERCSQNWGKQPLQLEHSYSTDRGLFLFPSAPLDSVSAHKKSPAFLDASWKPCVSVRKGKSTVLCSCLELCKPLSV